MSNQTDALRSCVSRYHYPALLQRLREAENEGTLEEQLQHEYTRNRRRVSLAYVDFAQLTTSFREAETSGTSQDWVRVQFPLRLPEAPDLEPEVRGPRSEVRVPRTETRAPSTKVPRTETRGPRSSTGRRCRRVHFGASPSFVHRCCNSTGKQALQFLTWVGLAEMPSCCPLGHEWTLEPHGRVLYWKCYHRLPGVRVARTTAELQALKDRAVNRPGPRPRACITLPGGRCGWSGKTGAYMGQTQI